MNFQIHQQYLNELSNTSLTLVYTYLIPLMPQLNFVYNFRKWMTLFLCWLIFKRIDFRTINLHKHILTALFLRDLTSIDFAIEYTVFFFFKWESVRNKVTNQFCLHLVFILLHTWSVLWSCHPNKDKQTYHFHSMHLQSGMKLMLWPSGILQGMCPLCGHPCVEYIHPSPPHRTHSLALYAYTIQYK